MTAGPRGGGGGTQGRMLRARPRQASGLGERPSGRGCLPDSTAGGDKQGRLAGGCDGGSRCAGHARRTRDEAAAPTTTMRCTT